jgi:uncharacterized alpha-E superfamily protein
LSNLLARYAEAIYWLARYVERAEDLARIVDVNETFSRDSRGGQNWRSVLQLHADEARYRERFGAPTAEGVIRFYTLDDSNPTSIVSALREARSNARNLRPLISTEMWTQMNIFYNRLTAMRPEELAQPRLPRFCSFVKENCQTHFGITEGTFYRDEGWYFYLLGRKLERADQTTRTLDVKYHLLLPSADQVGSPLDVSQWNALLRSVSGYHAFRRVHPSGMTPTDVAGFLLFHRAFPRSVAACVSEVDDLLHALRATYQLTGGAEAMERLDELRAVLSQERIDNVIRRGLHEFLDQLQGELIAVSQDLGRDFFGYAPPHGAASA